MPQIQDCKRELRYILSASEQSRVPHVIVSAAELHKRVFGEDAEQDPVCCAAMRSELRDGDTIVRGKQDDLGAHFTVCYLMPRPSPVVEGDAQD